MPKPGASTKLGRFLSNFSLDKLIILIIQFTLVVYLSFFTPLFVRYAFATKFVHHEEPLEFTFHTCDVHLAGVCSYPEAIMLISEEFELQPSYYHSFTLNLNLFDTEQNRRLGIFIASIYLKDESLNLLTSYNKGVPVIKNFPTRSWLGALFIKSRNVIFFPLYLTGFLSNEALPPETVIVDFPGQYLEKVGNRTQFITVQLQNKFIQLSSASLKIRAQVGLVSYIVSEFPIISYTFIFGISFTLYFTIFFLHWAYKGIHFFYVFDDV
ncbi:putative adipose-regulatory protein (Seipin) domain-containing protein [Ditylenchus destructor]|nr:putative adipose-regulatory protein (Seipin) domain-containing protein [Ditylenchus destructor]